MSRKSFFLVLSVLVLLFAAGLAAPARAAEEPFVSLDRQLVATAQAIPGFGGFFYDADGRPTVYLTDLAQADAVAQIAPGARVLEGQYDFAQLALWRTSLRSVFSHPGVVSLDVDEAQNRVRIGVDRASVRWGRAAVEREIDRHGVPRQAVIVEEVEPIHQLVTLQDQLRPIPGSVQIHFGNFLCTLGFNAVRNGVSGFVTNSHCTDRQGGVESTRYFQPLSPAAVATEIADPDYQRNISGCPRGRRCRFSDSSFAAYDSSSLANSGRIARTTFSGNLSGSLTIDPANPTFTITATGASAVGQQVNKIGRTTGWTVGTVSQTCTDVGVSGTNIVQLCQDIVDAGVGGGDSGSPVFATTGGGNVTLRGILWGGNSAGDLYVYSPFANIVSELGSLNVF